MKHFTELKYFSSKKTREENHFLLCKEDTLFKTFQLQPR